MAETAVGEAMRRIVLRQAFAQALGIPESEVTDGTKVLVNSLGAGLGFEVSRLGYRLETSLWDRSSITLAEAVEEYEVHCRQAT